ncbi:unnamed protein product [Peronospora belbahrii]|uniref:F-box domain-containing protein n=1 Tax=Peronospora belbahrii TaxID=622444 RepID=A0ABN8D5W0_9STRA|nr:unnamed protein product [Peronospora belbahrii]
MSPTWHDPTDLRVRKLMMVQIQSHAAMAQQHAILQTNGNMDTSPSLLQRLEWMLYHSAGSLSEYLHQSSLGRRVQGLVTHYKRKRSETDFIEDFMASIRASTTKRQRPRLMIAKDESFIYSTSARECVLNCNLDLLRHVCRFLDSSDLLRCRSMNKFLYLHAPSFVQSLHVDATLTSGSKPQDYDDGAATGLRSLLHECKNLTSLTISNQANQSHFKAGIVFPRALTASTASTSSYGHQLVCEVAHALKEGACPFLQSFELLAPFDFATESETVLVVLQALAGSSTEADEVRVPLQHLVLDATFLGDRGIKQLTDLFENRCAFFKHLQTLTVRNNFIGETGCRDLLEAIEMFSDLQTLDLSRNILTDTDALALADLLDDPFTNWSFCDSVDGNWKTSSEDDTDREQFSAPGLAGLRTLKLHENFITCDGFHAITIALCSREVFVTTIGNAAESRDAEQDDEYDDDDDDGDEGDP